MKKTKRFIKKLLNKIKPKHTHSAEIEFTNSSDYWEKRYANGGNSGIGSYDKFAEFKAEILNKFVKDNDIKNVVEFGCGDGNQLSLMNYPSYIGLDISITSVDLCKKKFKQDKTKSFFLINPLDEYHGQNMVDLTLSLDVIFHLIEEEVFEVHMNSVFNTSNKYVIIYSSNFDQVWAKHVKDRKFTDWIDKNIAGWTMYKKIDNKYKFDPNDEVKTSRSDFYFYKKMVD